MSRRESEQYNFVGLARSPPAKNGATPGAGNGYYTSSRSSKSYAAPFSACSTAPTDSMLTGSRRSTSSSHYDRHALGPMNVNIDFEPSLQQTPAPLKLSSASTSSWTKNAPDNTLGSANRSTLLVSRALRLSPASENKVAQPSIGGSPQPRAPPFHGEPSPVLSRTDTAAAAAVRSNAQAAGGDLQPELRSPVPASSRRSPVPAFTPGFEGDACSMQQSETPVQDLCLPSASCDADGSRRGNSDDGQWSDLSTSTNGAVFSPDLATPMPATARRLQAKKMAMSSKKMFCPPANMDDYDANASPPLQSTTTRGLRGGMMTGNTPTAVSALLQLANKGVRYGNVSRAHPVVRHMCHTDMGLAADDGEMGEVAVLRGDGAARREEEDVLLRSTAGASIDIQRHSAAPKSPPRTARISARRLVMTPRRPTAAAVLLEMSQGTPRRLIRGLIGGAGEGMRPAQLISKRQRFVPDVAKVAENMEEETPRRFIMGIVSDSHGPAEAGIKVPASSSTVANSGSAVAAAAAAAAAAARVAASSEATGAADGFVGGPDNTITNADVDSGPQNDTALMREETTDVVEPALVGGGGELRFNFFLLRMGKAVLKAIVILNYVVLSFGAVFVVVFLACLMCAEPRLAVPIY